MIDTIIHKTIEYLCIPSVVGHEKFFMHYLYQDFKKLGLSVFKSDGALEVHGDKREQNIICAHIDRHGLISLGDNEYVYAAQYIKEIKYGENNQSSRLQVQSIAERFEGEHVYAYHPDTGETLARGVIKSCYPNQRNDDALFDVDDILQLEQNIPLAYARKARFENDFLKGQIDNVLSLATVYTLFQSGYQGTAILACEEEIGKSWLHIAEYLDGMHIETDRLIVLDTSPYADPEILESGPIILRARDKTESFNTEFVDALKRRCVHMNMPYEVKDEMMLAAGKSIDMLGSTELGRLVDGTKGYWSGATVQVPTVMYHTSNETTSARAIKNYYAFLKDILIDNVI